MAEILSKEEARKALLRICGLPELSTTQIKHQNARKIVTEYNRLSAIFEGLERHLTSLPFYEAVLERALPQIKLTIYLTVEESKGAQKQKLEEALVTQVVTEETLGWRIAVSYFPKKQAKEEIVLPSMRPLLLEQFGSPIGSNYTSHGCARDFWVIETRDSSQNIPTQNED